MQGAPAPAPSGDGALRASARRNPPGICRRAAGRFSRRRQRRADVLDFRLPHAKNATRHFPLDDTEQKENIKGITASGKEPLTIFRVIHMMSTGCQGEPWPGTQGRKASCHAWCSCLAAFCRCRPSGHRCDRGDRNRASRRGTRPVAPVACRRGAPGILRQHRVGHARSRACGGMRSAPCAAPLDQADGGTADRPCPPRSRLTRA